MTDKLSTWGEWREEPRARGRGNNSNNAEAEQKMTKNGLTESGRRLAGICPQLELRMNTTVVVQWGEGGGLARSSMSSPPSGPARQTLTV